MISEIKHRIYTLVCESLTRISPTLNSKYVFRHRTGAPLRLNPPRTFNEKLMWLKLYRYSDDPLAAQLADKYAMRAYVEQRGCGQYLVPLLGVYDDASQIPWESLPNQFALKWNFGSGYNILCTDKAKLDIADTVRKLNHWKTQKPWLLCSEMHYRLISKKIVCEQYLNTADGKPPADYKIFCGYGEPKLLYVVSDRGHHTTHFDFYTMDWEWLPVQNGYPNTGVAIKKPDQLSEMLDIARKLAGDFPLVRIDFYLEAGRIYVGEITFTHHSCHTPFKPDEYDRIFGDMFPIDREWVGKAK